MSVVKKTAVQTAVWMLILNLGCKALGFIREMAMAAFYGAGYIVDSFVMAQSIPNILLGGVLVAISTAYMPLFSKEVENNGEEAGNHYTSQVIFLLVGLSFVTAVLGAIFAEPLVNIMAAGFNQQASNLTAFYLRVTFGYTVFSSIVGIYAGYLQYKGGFLLQIVGDYLQNASVILMIIVSAYTDDRLLAFGLFLGYGTRCFLLGMLARKRGFRFKFRFIGMADNVKRICALSIPVFLGTTMHEINTFVDRTLASGLGSGSISALNYAHQINTIVISLSITILTTIIYPKLVQLGAGEDKRAFNETIQRGFSLVIMIAVPVTIGSVLYGESIIRTIYERGQFNTEATSITAWAYCFYALGILFLSINDYMTKVYYSLHDMKSPMICAGLGLGANIVLNCILVYPMRQNGLALATSLAALITTVLQVVIFKRKHKRLPLINSKSKIVAIAIASIVSIFISYGVFYLLRQVCRVYEIISLASAVGLALLIYFVMLKMFKVSEVNYIMRSLLRRTNK